MLALKPVDFLMGLLVSITWGLGVVFAKAALEYFPPILLMSFRFLITALVLVWFAKIPVGRLKRLALIAFIAATLQYALTYSGLAHLDASTAILIIQMEVPFMVILGAEFLGEKTSLKKWVGIGLAFCGLAIVAGTPQVAGKVDAILLIVGGTFFFAVGQCMIAKTKDVNAKTMTAWVAVFAAPQLFALSLAIESNHYQLIVDANWVVWAAVLYMGIVMTAFGYGLWYSLISRNPIGNVAPFLLILPLWSIAGSIFFLGETLTLHTVIGGMIIIFGLALILIERQKPS